MNRKEFIVAVGRYILLSGLLLVSGILIKNRHDYPEKCVENPFCKDCGDLENCSLPKAMKEKGYGKE